MKSKITGKDNRTVSLPSEIVQRLDARNRNRSAQITEELENLYLLYAQVGIKKKFAEPELNALVRKLVAVDLEKLSESVPVRVLVRKLLGAHGKEEGISEQLAKKISLLTDLELFALIDELRVRYHTEREKSMRMMLSAAAGRPAREGKAG